MIKMANNEMESFGGKPHARFPFEEKEGRSRVDYLNIDFAKLEPVYDNGNARILNSGSLVKV